MANMTIKILSGLGLALALQNVWAGAITDIKVSSLSEGKKIIKIKFDQDVVEPKGFVKNAPPKIALDFPNTQVKLDQNVLQYNDPILGQIIAAADSNRARVALDLKQESEYYTERKGDEIWVYVSAAKSAAVTAPVVVRTPPPVVVTVEKTTTVAAPEVSTPYQNQPSGVALDFRKGNQGSGRVELAIPAAAASRMTVKRQADRLVITVPNMPISVAEQRRLDVTDFSTPVRTVSMIRVGNNTQLTIANNGTWDYKTTQSGGRQVFEIVPKTDVASRGLGSQKPKNFSGGRVTLDFQDVEVRTILQILAKESGMNIVASDSVTGKMTLSLKDVPWDQALDLVMQARNLDMRRQGNIINIAPRAELVAKDKEVLQAENELQNLGPLVSQTFQLKYKNVEEFKKILRIEDTGSSSKNSILSDRGSALIDPATNTLIITDNLTVIRKFQRIIEELDVPARQVMIEARIVEADEGFSRDLGMKLGGQFFDGSGNSWGSNMTNNLANISAKSANNLAMQNYAIQAAAAGTTPPNIPSPTPFTWAPNINLPATAATSALSFFRSTASGMIGLELTAMELENRGKIISSPRVVTQNLKEATIEEGAEIAYQEATSSGATSTTFKKAVLGLTVTPNITPDGNIIMNLKINKDSVANYTTGALNVKRVNTNVMVENGGTIVVGGVYVEENSNAVDKVPLLGDIPLLGNLFKKRLKKETRRELLVFITPRIMDNIGSNLRY